MEKGGVFLRVYVGGRWEEVGRSPPRLRWCCGLC